MKIDVLSEKENPLLKRKEVVVRILHSGATPTRSEIRNKLVAKLNADSNTLILSPLEQRYGSAETLAKVKIYRSKERALQVESRHIIRKNFHPKEKVKKPKEEKEKAEKPAEEAPKEKKEPEAKKPVEGAEEKKAEKEEKREKTTKQPEETPKEKEQKAAKPKIKKEKQEASPAEETPKEKKEKTEKPVKQVEEKQTKEEG
ncbi:MAG: 30S ribosomal protein S24e [Candidatus Hydrothermarchaeales archaeon]